MVAAALAGAEPLYRSEGPDAHSRCYRTPHGGADGRYAPLDGEALMTEATHTLQGAPVTDLRKTPSPWEHGATEWFAATRLDTGETVTAPLSYFVPVCDGRETPVNDSQTLTHDMVMRAIQTDDPHEAARLMRSYADEADRVGATALAARLREYAANRVLNAEPDLSAIDRSIDSVLAFWPERERRSRSGSCLVALETLYPDVSRVVLAERIASAQLARSIAPSLRDFADELRPADPS